MTPHDEFQAACVQFDVSSGDVAANVAAMQSGIEEAAGAGARLCVLPEMWSTSFLTDYDDDVLGQARDAEESLRALTELSAAPKEKLGRHVYNIAAMSPTAQEFADAVIARVGKSR